MSDIYKKAFNDFYFKGICGENFWVAKDRSFLKKTLTWTSFEDGVFQYETCFCVVDSVGKELFETLSYREALVCWLSNIGIFLPDNYFDKNGNCAIKNSTFCFSWDLLDRKVLNICVFGNGNTLSVVMNARTERVFVTRSYSHKSKSKTKILSWDSDRKVIKIIERFILKICRR